MTATLEKPIAPRKPKSKPILAMLENMCRDLLQHDLPASTKFYVVDGRAVGMTRDGEILGMHAWNLDMACLEYLGERWEGRGPAIALNLKSLLDIANTLSLSNERSAVKARYHCLARAVAIHETAHAVVAGLDRGPMPPSSDAHRVVALNIRICKMVAADPAAQVDRETVDLAHGEKFIRCAIHLYERACMRPDCRMLMFHELWLLDTEQYQLSPTRNYVDALGDEPERLQDVPLTEILRTPAPVAFTELFQRDDAARRELMKGSNRCQT